MRIVSFIIAGLLVSSACRPGTGDPVILRTIVGGRTVFHR
jgi:hypothetical protein